MNDYDLRPIVDSLVKRLGVTGAFEYISSGDYPFELKARIIDMMKVDIEMRCASAMVIDGDIYDFDNALTSESGASREYAS